MLLVSFPYITDKRADNKHFKKNIFILRNNCHLNVHLDLYDDYIKLFLTKSLKLKEYHVGNTQKGCNHLRNIGQELAT